MEATGNYNLAEEYPSWLNEDFFEEVLQKEEVKVSHLTLEAANKKGENYSSIMLRAGLLMMNADRSLAKRSLIVKLDPVGMTQDIMNKFNVFPKEIEVYKSIIPRLEALYKNVGMDIEFSPMCLRTSSGRDPGNSLIMEDLCERGFRTANRLEGLDLEHMDMALAALAKFHAASAVNLQEADEISKHFSYGLYAEHMKPILYEVYRKNIELMRGISADWDCQEAMHRFLDNYKEKMLDRVFELVSIYREEDRFRVLCHGDFWCNNVMFRYGEDNYSPQQCLLLDFQLANYNSPAFDLNYFIFTSARKDIKLAEMDHFIHHYHQELVSNLNLLGYSGNVPTLSGLHREFQELGAYGLNSTYGTLCAVVAPPGTGADMNSLLGDDEASKEFRRKLFSNSLYKEALEQLIPYFYRKGLF